MSYQANEQNYLELIRQFLDSEIDDETFCDKWFSLWRNDRDEQDSQTDTWSERFDLQLLDALSRNEITNEEFSKKWIELWGYGEYEDLLEMVDHIFTACDAYNPKPERDYEIDEDGLRTEVKLHLANYEKSKSNLHQ